MSIDIPIPQTQPAAPTPVASTSVQSIGTQMVATAQGFMAALQTAGNFIVPQINPTFPTIDTAPRPMEATFPKLQTVAWSTPTAPADSVGPAPNITSYLPGPFTGTAPSVAFSAIPTPDYGVTPNAPAIDLNFTYPTLSLNIPPAPSLLGISVAPFGGVTLPTFNASVPTLTVAPPQTLAYKEGAIYVSTLLSSLETDLNVALTTGKGLVVGGAVENALWDNAREREYRQQADALADLDRMSEELGYALPPGVWLDSRIKIQTETNNTIAGLSRDIMVQQAKDLLENLKQVREIAEANEAKQIEYANQIAQRAFETAKYATEANIQIYNANVEAYKAALDGYRSQAQVFDTLMKGAQTQVDIYKAELEAEHLKAEVNQIAVQQYSELIKAQELFVDIYKAELGAIETQANLQKIVVEAYGEQIRAFVGKVQAYTAEVDAYKAQLQSQEVVMQIFKTEVDAYAAEAQAGAAEANAVIAGYRATIEGYTAQLEGYKAAIQAMVEQARAASEYNQAAADVFRSETQGWASYNQVLTEQWKAVATIGEQEAEVAIKAAEAQGQMYISSKQIAVEAIKGGGQVAAQIGAAALNAIHWSESMSWTSSLSSSIGATFSQVEEQITSTSV